MTVPEALQKMVDGLCSTKTQNVSAQVQGDTVRLKFPYTPAVIEACKKGGGRWNPGNKSWDWTVFGVARGIEAMAACPHPIAGEITENLRGVHANKATHKERLEEKRRQIMEAIDGLFDLPNLISSALVAGS